MISQTNQIRYGLGKWVLVKNKAKMQHRLFLYYSITTINYTKIVIIRFLCIEWKRLIAVYAPGNPSRFHFQSGKEE